jgi:phosphate transport system substrate-binding protein
MPDIARVETKIQRPILAGTRSPGAAMNRRSFLTCASLRGRPWATLFLGLLAILLASGGCNSSPTSSRPLSIAGSTSVQPFAEKLAEIYMHQHPGCRIDVQGGGSSAGIYAAEQGAADLGTSSRELVPAEKNLTEIPIAYDGIAVIVHPSNPLTNLSLKQIREIFTDQIKDWGSLGLPPHAIDLITREEGSGTREAFEHLVMQKHEITPTALVQDSNGSVREIVAGDPYSLGYISAGLVNDRVKAVAIDGVLPTPDHIRNHTYKLVRRFLLVSRGAPTGTCQAFVDFVLSPPGQKVLESEGLVGVK